MFGKLICAITHRHKWRFVYNYGIPLGCNWSYEKIEQLRKEGKVFEVHRCTRCGKYDHESDHLLPSYMKGADDY